MQRAMCDVQRAMCVVAVLSMSMEACMDLRRALQPIYIVTFSCKFKCIVWLIVSQTISSSQDHSLLNLLTLYLVSRDSLVTLLTLQ